MYISHLRWLMRFLITVCAWNYGTMLCSYFARRDSELQSKPKSRIIPYNRDLMEFVLRTADDRTQRPYRTWYVYIVRTRVSHVCLSTVSNLSLTRCQRCQICQSNGIMAKRKDTAINNNYL